jgi:NADPH-dependent curcumin reductase CurA
MNESTRSSVILRRRPVGEPKTDDFELMQDAIPTPGDGQVVTRTLWLSIDPYMRGRLSDQKSYAAPVQIGAPMEGEGIGEVIASGDPAFAVGDIVLGTRLWQSHVLCKAAGLVKLDPTAAPIQACPAPPLIPA